MKICICLFAILIASSVLHAQALDKGYYITVAAFAPSKESYAKRFVDQLNKDGFNSHYALDVKRHILLVYIEEFSEYSPSIREMLAVRAKARFPDAWVRIIKDSNGEATVNNGKPVETANNTVTSTGPEPLEKVGSPAGHGVAVKPVEAGETRKSDPDSVLTESPIITESSPPDTSSPRPSVSSSPHLIFHMFDANNSNPIEGKIEIIDTERARFIQENKSTDTLEIPDPASKSKQLSFITDVFGYRKVQHELNYKQPLVDSVKHYVFAEGDYYVLQFEMVRYHKGDIATLYNVFFFNDAAIMMPESRYELNQLLDMMQSNPNYRIMLHGHTNGNGHGKILLMGPSKEFFSLKANDVKQSSGSAKELSGRRAEVIREWLIAQGISGDRIEIKSWGGRRMIHDKNSANARKNVRVEVEVLSE